MSKVRHPRAEALQVARQLCQALKPVTTRLVVAGSLRRMKAEVGDVEILFIPRFQRQLKPGHLWETQEVDLAAEVVDRLVADGVLSHRINKIGGTSWGAKNKLAVHCSSGIPVDLFTATEANWWNYLVCRTGPKESNTAIAEAAQRKALKWHPYGSGFTDSAGAWIRVRSEREVFDLVGLPYLEPSCR